MNPLATAVGLALVHFVWQGFLLGALIAGVLAALRHRPASVRYLVCVGGMTLLLLTPVATLLLLQRSPAGAWSLPILHGTGVVTGHASPVLPLLPFLWGAGVIVLQIRMAVAWVRAESLRRIGTGAASLRWQREFDDLRARLSVKRPVRLLASSRVVVPAVVGWLRPVVLVPVSLTTGLGPDEIRGLLAHELAHVRRHDYLVNLAQGLFESLLFFHPVTWWLSGRLRAEREFCCDDVALTVGGGALAYARTLSSLEELRDRTALPALSATGGTLMTRIVRILGGATHGRSRAALILGLVTVAGGITLGSLMATGCFQNESAIAAPSAEPAAAASVELDRVLSTVDAAVADGRLSAELAATIRTKIESGEAQVLTVTCNPDGTCEMPADCPPGACPPGSCPPAACAELAECAASMASGDGEPVCIMIQCDDETDCTAACPSGAAGSARCFPAGDETARVEFVELGR